MSMITEQRPDMAAHDGGGMGEQRWDGIPARIFLQPIAAPSVLGLLAFAAATFVVGSHMGGWWGTNESSELVFPFVAMLGGVAQFAAGMWAFKARDALATAVHGLWGAFWMAYGILFALFATGTLVEPSPDFTGLGFWFFALAMITGLLAFAALAESIALFLFLGTLAVASTIAAPALIYGSSTWTEAAGWVLVFSAGFAAYAAGAMLLADTYGRTILPLGKYRRAANVPGRMTMHPVQYAEGMPGVKKGQ